MTWSSKVPWPTAGPPLGIPIHWQMLAFQDVVMLQEVFLHADASLLVNSAKAGRLKHAHFFNSGMLHGELLLLSTYPIYEVSNHFKHIHKRYINLLLNRCPQCKQHQLWCWFAGTLSWICYCRRSICAHAWWLLCWQGYWSCSPADLCRSLERIQYSHLRQLLP